MQTKAPFTSSLAEAIAPDLLDRFLRYVRIDTQSSRERSGSPSTPGQLDLARLLVEELRAIGLEDAAIDDNGIVTATLEATVDDAPTIGLLAHMDTSPDAPGAGVEPIVHEAYDGTELALPRGGTVLAQESMPVLGEKRGHDIVSSSGDTLLGAYDNAGVAEIMAALTHLAAHPELPRARLRVGFTPDEEIGAGAFRFDVDGFGARCAYTLDGSQPGELQDETFSAAEVVVTVTGVEVHPGWAKGVLVNAARLAARILAALPSDHLTPETTEDREGFIHPYEMEGDAGRAVLRFIVRDFDDEALEQHVELVRNTAEEIVGAEPRAKVDVAVTPQYSNMRRHLESDPEIVQRAERALHEEGVEPVRTPIRGGTDGSIISAMGLPTPNLFTGGHEYHSVREWASVQDMASAAAVAVRLAGVWAQREA
jgi:tripeptide aminopeptidase